jgi:hypothetical protein
MKWILLLCWTAAGCLAQPLTVYTELARLDPFGKVLAPETPREILSPALARNAFTSFQIAITAPTGEHWSLYVGQNPENAVTLTIYRQTSERLEPVRLPVEGDGPAVFWMDVWTPKEAPVRRIKIEPQLNFRNDWVIYPVEGRVMEATVPDGPWPAGVEPSGEVMRGLLCGAQAKPAGEASAGAPGLTMARLHHRNSEQDLALALRAPSADLANIFGACNAPVPEDPEWYLHVRDYLFRLNVRLN